MPAVNVLPSLQGYRIALTIAADAPISPAGELRAREAALFYYPVSQTLPPNGYDELDSALRRCRQGEVQWLLLTTPCAVEAVNQRLAELQIDPSALSSVKIALYGGTTRLTVQSLAPSWSSAIADQSTHRHFVAAMNLSAGDTVVVPLALHSRADWQPLLESAGAETVAVPAYRLILGRGGDDLPGLLWGGLIDAIVFLTENNVRHFAIRLKAEGGSLDMLGDVVVACLDAQTAAAARAYDLNVKVVPEQPAYATLAAALAHYFEAATVRA